MLEFDGSRPGDLKERLMLVVHFHLQIEADISSWEGQTLGPPDGSH